MKRTSENKVGVSVDMSQFPITDIHSPTVINRDLLRTFMAISKALNLAQPLSDTLDLIAEKVSQTMGHKYCAVLLANEKTRELRIEGSFGLSQEYVRAVNEELVQQIDGTSVKARSVTAQAYKTRMPVYAADITVDSRFRLWREAALKAGYKSIVALPLIFRNEVIGVLNCYDEPRQYTEDQVEALMVVAEQAASAVGIVRLIDEQRATIDKLNSLNEHVASQHALLQRSARAHEALAALLLEDCTLDNITDTLAELLKAPAVLQDDRLRVLSRSEPGEEEYCGLPSDDSVFARIQSGLIGVRENRRAKSLELESEDRRIRTVLVAPVDMGGYGWGYLSAPLTDDSEKDFFLRTLEQAITIYALYTIRQRVSQETEERIKGDLLVDLVISRSRDEAEVKERAQYLDLDFASGPFRILVVRHEALAGYLKRRDLNVGAESQVRGKLLALVRNFVVAIAARESEMVGVEGENLVMLLSCLKDSDPHHPAERLLQMIRNEFPDLRARVGVSAPCMRPMDLANRYEEVRFLLDIAERLDAPRRTIYCDDWVAYGLLLHGNSKEELLSLAHKVLDPLLAQEKNGQSELLATLQAYLTNGLSPTQTAKTLYAHRNTVKYRLKKISKLLALDLGCLDDVLTVKVALMVRSLDPESFDTAIRGSNTPPS